ncbi:hypothetical protein Tco_1290674, partial [Tanacetum coccineum]
DSWGIRAASSATGVVCMFGGCEIDGALIGVCWGDKDGEDFILEGDDSNVVWIVGSSP